MNSRQLLAAAILALTSLGSQSAPAAAPPLIAGVNDVRFNGSAEQAFLGSGFVIEHQGRWYGVTAKHVLLMRKDGPPTSTDIQGQLDHWRLRDPRSQDALEFGPLVNGNAAEAVDLGVLKLDALVFELEDAGPFTPLRLATTRPERGDRLHAVGCAYASEATCAQDTYAGNFLEQQGPNLLIDLGDQSLDAMFGLSGAPVLNEAGELVGIVSNVMPDASGEPRFAPVDVEYLREVLDGLQAG